MKRIQRKRTKGWKKPQNAVIIDRTSKWGNPFKLIDGMIYCDASHRIRIRITILGKWVLFGIPIKGLEHQALVDLHKQWLEGETWENRVKPCSYRNEQIRKELKDRDLVCYCKESEPWHGDNLIEIAAKPEERE